MKSRKGVHAGAHGPPVVFGRPNLDHPANATKGALIKNSREAANDTSNPRPQMNSITSGASFSHRTPRGKTTKQRTYAKTNRTSLGDIQPYQVEGLSTDEKFRVMEMSTNPAVLEALADDPDESIREAVHQYFFRQL